MVKVQTMKGVAIHIGPESGTVARKGGGEALTGECVGRAIEPRNLGRPGCRRSSAQRKATPVTTASARWHRTPCGRGNPSMHGSILRENREIPNPSPPDGGGDRAGKSEDTSQR